MLLGILKGPALGGGVGLLTLGPSSSQPREQGKGKGSMAFPLREQPKVAYITFAYIPWARNQPQTISTCKGSHVASQKLLPCWKERGRAIWRQQRPLLSAILSPWGESLCKDGNNTEEGREEGWSPQVQSGWKLLLSLVFPLCEPINSFLFSVFFLLLSFIFLTSSFF